MIVSSSLKVRIIQGKELLACDSNGLSDPYCLLTFGVSATAKKKKTQTKKKTLTPFWDESFVFPVNNIQQEKIFIQVWDWDIGSDDEMGGVSIPILGLVSGIEKVQWYPLSTKGFIEVGLTAVGFDSSGLSPTELAAVYSSNAVDNIQIPRYQPPSRYIFFSFPLFFPRQLQP